MKTLLSLLMLCIVGISMAYAEIPKATVTSEALHTGQWPAQYRLTLTVPANHHAYLDAGDENIYIPVTLDPNKKLAVSGVLISKLQKPAGTHDDLVKATVLRDRGDFELELTPNGVYPVKSQPLDLELSYQLCNESTNVCFRPQTAHTELMLPAPASMAAAAAPAEEEHASFTDQLLLLFKNNQNNMLVMFGLMALAGLLSVATPCVYPMLPITSMFIIGRANGEARNEKRHASAYMIGMVITYMLLGLLAGMTGGAFNTFMQSAFVNLAFALFFAFFGISLLGFYELSFMQNEVHSLDQQSSRIKGLAGTLLMGCVAGLVVSPCVGPIVFALLLQVADNIAAKSAALAALNQSLDFWSKLGIAAQGGLMMSGFGIGVGLPFFIVSVVKFRKLPKAGYWMNKIKYTFGLLILYFAYTYLEKGMGILRVDPATTATLAIGMAAIWIAVVHCHVLSLLPQDALPNQKMQHYVGVMSILVGGWLVLASLGNLPFMNTTQAGFAAQNGAAGSTAAQLIEQEAGISWYRNYDAAKQVARQTGKPIFIDFYASWCANCQEFKKTSASNEQLNLALREKAIAVKLVDQEPDFEKFRSSPEHRQLKIGLPYFAIITPDGKIAWSGTDYKATQKMVAALNKFS